MLACCSVAILLQVRHVFNWIVIVEGKHSNGSMVVVVVVVVMVVVVVVTTVTTLTNTMAMRTAAATI